MCILIESNNELTTVCVEVNLRIYNEEITVKCIIGEGNYKKQLKLRNSNADM